MNINDVPPGKDLASTRDKPIGWARLIMLAVKLAGGILAMAVLVPWTIVLTPQWLVRGATLAFLWTLLATFVVAVPAAVFCGGWSFLRAVRAYKRGDRPVLRRHLRWALLASSCLLGLIAMELGSAGRLRWMLRIPDLPTHFTQPAKARLRSDGGRRAALENGQQPDGSGSDRAEGLYIVVVGESSARGEPYHPWLSVGQLVGWQLESIFPGRPIRVDIRADGGLCLEQAVLLLGDLERRPDVMIVFAGHNEFQTRFGWSRNVSHYVEEGVESPLVLLELARATSSACKLILNTLDTHYGEAPPPPRVTRELVDHPVCSPSEYAFLREDFRIRLDALTGYCTRIGSLPILIVPGSNDGSFEPSRSVLSGSTPVDQRAAFAHNFQAIRAAEPVDAQASISGYRRLLDQHPEFAEAHYRLGRLLAASGAWEEAMPHFVLARDLDGLPLRCPGDFREAVRTVARGHGAVLIDGPQVLARASPHGVLDDHLFHDAQHVNLAGTIALANDILAQLKRRGAIGWPVATPAPRIELEACALHFRLDAPKWAEICARTCDFHERTAYVRYDPSSRLRIAEQFHQASLDFAAGRPLRDAKLPSLALAVSLLPPALKPAATTDPLGPAEPQRARQGADGSVRPPVARSTRRKGG